MKAISPSSDAKDISHEYSPLGDCNINCSDDDDEKSAYPQNSIVSQQNTGTQKRRTLLYIMLCGALLTIGFLIGFYWDAFDLYFCNEKHGNFASQCPAGLSEAEYDDNGVRIQRIVLYGDSLMSVPNEKYDMGRSVLDNIESKKSGLFDIVVSGHNANQIASLKQKLPFDCLNYQPDAVILIWDSDVSEHSVSDSLSTDIIDEFNETLEEVVVTILDHIGNKRLAIGGFIMIGELPEGQNEKDPSLNVYLNLTSVMAKKHDLPFINLREIFQKADEKKGWSKSSGYLTLDGEHPSREGSDLMVAAIGAVLEAWY